MTFAATGSFLATTSGPSITTSAVGNLYLLSIGNATNLTVTATAVSSTNATWTFVGSHGSSGAVAGTVSLFIGRATSAATATASITWSGTTPTSVTHFGHEFTSTAGSWTVARFASFDNASPDSHMVALSAPQGSIYFGAEANANVATNGSTSGFTYATVTNGNSAVFGIMTSGGTADPAMGGDAHAATGMAMVVIENVLPVTAAAPQTMQVPPSPPSKIIGALAALFAGSASLSGSGTLSAAPAFTPSAALSGSGTLSAQPGTGPPGIVRALQYYAVPPPSPPSGIVGVLQPTTFASAPLSGSGSLSATPVFSGSAALLGSGTLSAAPVLAASAALSGTGTLMVVPGPGVGGPIPSVIYAPVQYARPPPSPPSQIIAFASAAFTGSAALSGSGTLSAAPVFAASAALSGTGTLAVAPAPGVGGPVPAVIAAPAQYAKAPPSPPSQIVAFPSPVFASSASLSGSGTLSAAPVFSGSASLSGAGTLSAVWTVSYAPVIVQALPVQPVRAPAVPSRIIGSTLGIALGSASLSGTGTLSAGPAFTASAALSGSGTLAGGATIILQQSYGTARVSSAPEAGSPGSGSPAARGGSGGGSASAGGGGPGARTGGNG